MSYAQGVDVSFWQGINNWNQVASKVNFAFIRAGQSVYIDSKFFQNWEQSKGKILRGAYWFYDWRGNGGTPDAQAKKFKETVQPVGELPMVMDFENPYAGWSSTPFPTKTNALSMIQRFRDALKVERMIIYCNPSTLKQWTPLPYWLTEDYDLWIANYPYATGTTSMVKDPSEIPSGWKPSTYGWEWKFWQYTSKLPGVEYGVGSGDLDGNMFNGDITMLKKYASVEMELTDAEKIQRLWEAHPELH